MILGVGEQAPWAEVMKVRGEAAAAGMVVLAGLWMLHAQIYDSQSQVLVLCMLPCSFMLMWVSMVSTLHPRLLPRFFGDRLQLQLVTHQKPQYASSHHKYKQVASNRQGCSLYQHLYTRPCPQ